MEENSIIEPRRFQRGFITKIVLCQLKNPNFENFPFKFRCFTVSLEKNTFYLETFVNPGFKVCLFKTIS